MTNIFSRHKQLKKERFKHTSMVNSYNLFLVNIHCMFLILDLCFIDDTCYGDGQMQSDKNCNVCKPNISRTNWTIKTGLYFDFYILFL